MGVGWTKRRGHDCASALRVHYSRHQEAKVVKVVAIEEHVFLLEALLHEASIGAALDLVVTARVLLGP